MKRLSVFGIIMITWWCSVACGSDGAPQKEIFDRVVYSPKYATGFQILQADDSPATLLRVTRPWQGASQEQYEVLIKGAHDKVPSGYHGAVINAPARRIVALSSSNVAMFDRLGVADRIVGVSGLEYISSPQIAQRAQQGLLFDVGYDSNLNFELLISLKPDIVLLSSSTGANSSITAKLDQLKIPYLYIGDYAEESPLGKAEWMVAMGELCGLREQAQEAIACSAEAYEQIRAMMADAPSKPLVMLNAPYRDIWYMPHSSSYMVQLIADAGGQYIYSGNTSDSSKPISIEEAYLLATKAQVWLNIGSTINSLRELRAQVPKFADMNVVSQGQVYNNAARRTPMGGSDFWESGVVYPERVLEDIAKILHPERMVGSGELFYYNQLQ